MRSKATAEMFIIINDETEDLEDALLCGAVFSNENDALKELDHYDEGYSVRLIKVVMP
jgi:hypothetical protein